MIVVLASGIVLAACGGGSSAGSSTPVASAAEAAMGFLRAAADSNVTRMAELWGTSSGPASKTNQPTDYQRRIVVMQSFLWSDSSKVVGQAAVPGDDDRRTVTVADTRTATGKLVRTLATRAVGGVIAVGPGSPGSSARARIEIARDVVARGDALLIFPEVGAPSRM